MCLVLEKLDIRVKEITLGDMNAAEAELVNEREDSGSDGSFPDGGDGSEGAYGTLVTEHNTVELRDVEVIRGGARGDGERVTVAVEDGFGDGEN